MELRATCDVDDCREPRMLALQRPSWNGLVEAGFCESHAFDLAAQRAVLARHDAAAAAPQRVA